MAGGTRTSQHVLRKALAVLVSLPLTAVAIGAEGADGNPVAGPATSAEQEQLTPAALRGRELAYDRSMGNCLAVTR